MGYLSTVEKNKVVSIYEELKTGEGIGNKCKKVSEIAKGQGIHKYLSRVLCLSFINGLKWALFLVFV